VVRRIEDRSLAGLLLLKNSAVPSNRYGSSQIAMGLSSPRRINIKLVLSVAFVSVFAFVGTSVLVLGLVMREWIIIIPGMLMAFLVHLPLLSTKPRLKPLAALLAALVVGMLSGTVLGDWTRLLFGLIAGTLWGSVVGLVLSAGLFSFFMPGLSLGPIKIHLLPETPVVGVVLVVLLGLGMIAGGVLGFMYLRDGIANLYGSLGGGIMLGWSIGAIIAYRLKHRPSQASPPTVAVLD
jgi:hypothetical protein